MKTGDRRKDIEEIFRAAVEAVQPHYLVPGMLKLTGDKIKLGEEVLPADTYENYYIAGAGKATAAMAAEVEKILEYRIADGVIAIKEGHQLPLKYVRQIEAGHPYPTLNSVIAAEDVMSVVKKAGRNDMVIFLLSGGASSLLTDLPYGCNLDDLQTTYKLLVNCGATINEVNTVRKHLSSIKGGQLLKLNPGAALVSFIISDVVGNDLSSIGSGPTAPDPTTYPDAMQVIEKYDLEKKLPEGVINHLRKGFDKIIDDTPKAGDPIFKKCYNYILADNHMALTAAAEKAKALGYETHIIDSPLEGDTEEAARLWVQRARTFKLSHKHCLIAGGETTINVTGTGKGGRNQHFALAAAIGFQNDKNITLLAAGTDGTDGPTDAAGAIVDGDTCKNAESQHEDAQQFLHNHDAYSFFEKAGGLLKTGPTQTNVMDIVITLIN